MKKFLKTYNQKKDLKCPLPKCYKLFTKKDKGRVKFHVALHFYKIVTVKFPYVKDQPCSICNSAANKTRTGHVYHYGIKHKALINIIPDTDERKEIALTFLDLRKRK